MKPSAFWPRALLAVAAAAALGALAATAVLKVYFPEPKVRALVVDAARRQLGREVRLERIGVGLRGLTLRGLSISESPDFSAGTFVSADLLRVRPGWRALLRRKLVVASVAAEGLSVRVVRRADGAFNFSNLASSAPSAGAAPAPAGAAPSAEFDVRRVLVTGSQIEYEDKSGGSSWNASEVGLDVEGLRADAPFGVALTARVQGRVGRRPIDARVALDGRVDLARGSRDGFSAEAKRLVVETSGLKLEGRARTARLDAPQISFDAELSAAGRRVLRASGTAKAGTGVEFDAKLASDPLDAALLARLFPGAGVPDAGLPAAELTAAGTWADAGASVRAARLTWDGGRVSVSGSARGLDGASPRVEGTLSFAADVPKIGRGQYPFLRLPPRLSLPALRAEGEAALAGGDLTVKSLTLRSAVGSVEASGAVRRATTAKPVPDLTLKAALTFDAFRPADLPFDNSLPPTLRVPPLRIDGGVVLRGDDVRLDKLGFKTGAGSVVIDGTLARALAGEWAPDLDAVLDLSLPALSDADLPFSGVPAGLRLPASRWNGGLSYSPRALRLRGLRARLGRNDVEADGAYGLDGRGAFDTLFKCRAFDLKELTGLTPATRDLQLAGTGYFALSVTGTKEKPIFAGKARFSGLGATEAGLPLSGFAGTLSVDPTRFDVPNLIGKIADANLKMDLTVKDYARAPEVQVDAKVDRFDLGRYLEAKKRLLAERAAAPGAAKAGAAGPSAAPAPIRTRGTLEIGALVHPNATVEQIRVSWELAGVAADLKRLNGVARLAVGGGKLRSLGDLATQSKVVKVLILPLLIVQKIVRVAGLRLFPDFNDITLRGIVGDYAFKDGVMTLNKSEMDSNAAAISARGTIDVPTEALALVVTAQVAAIAPIDVDVAGTFDDPKTKVRLGKFISDPAKQLIQGLLGK
jgi:hypothetical protein